MADDPVGVQFDVATKVKGPQYLPRPDTRIQKFQISTKIG